MNHTEQLYEITKYTKKALEVVERGCNPYYEFGRIKMIVDMDDGFKRKKLMIDRIKKFIHIFFSILSVVIAFFYGFRGIGVMMETERFWPGFRHILFATPFAALFLVLISDSF